MPKTSFNGTEFVYEEIGNGEPLVFVHGSAGDRRTWHLQKKEFTGFRLLKNTVSRFKPMVMTRRTITKNLYLLTDHVIASGNTATRQTILYYFTTAYEQ